ncbi:MAG: WD40/YVTN/BNR-like repeat-containing protein [Candidatus Binatia bacterium]
MAKDCTICVGTIGAGVWFSPNGGERWKRSKMRLPFHAEPGEIQIRNLSVFPQNPNHLLAGSEVGIYRSEDKGATWELVDSPVDGQQVWSLGIHPTDPNILFAGTKPPGVYRSTDGGKRWEKLTIAIAEKCLAGAPKVTNIVFDPRNPRTVWVSVEIDGLYRSDDGGDTWTHLPPLGEHELNQDVHGFTITQGPTSRLLVTTPDGIWTSTNDGQSWTVHPFPRFFERDKISYCRGVAVKPDSPDVWFVANGDFIPGRTGAIQRSTDGGKTWTKLPLPVQPNSTMYWIATHPADPNFVVANSLHGYVYTSDNGGDSWQKLEHEFGEVRALAWVPN